MNRRERKRKIDICLVVLSADIKFEIGLKD